jgi:hypothetical protein
VSQDEVPDPDRAAILARRRRFIALAISGLATGGCKHTPEPCLSIPIPNDDAGEGEGEGEGVPEGQPSASEPFVEDPGTPVEGGTGETGGSSEAPPQPNPQPCLRKQPTPRACLNVYRK